jgi:DNA polymerase III alpha subunit (gram-positive type)
VPRIDVNAKRRNEINGNNMKANNNYIVLDIETGGLSADKNPITEIGWVVLNPDLEEIDSYQTYVQGYDGLEHGKVAMDMTGIIMDMINSGITKAELIKVINATIKKYAVKGRQGKPVLAGHNIIDFDMKFIRYLIPDIDKKVRPQVLDTLWMSRDAWGRDDSMANFKLGTCCQRIGVDISNAHRALDDVRGNKELLVYHLSSMRGKTAIINNSDDSKEKQRASFRF